MSKPPMSGWNGFLNVDKPRGQTSRDVVNSIQALLPRRTKVGHAGTLDPLATGVLVVALGQATRLVEEVQNQTKVYFARIRLGYTSSTDDAEGEIIPSPQPHTVTIADIESLLPKFQGEIQQRPPKVSALKVAGRRAHELVRQGEEFTVAPRAVRIDRIELLDFQGELLTVRVSCGKGTYIRSIARDLGEELSCGGYIEELRREQIGSFRVESAIKPPFTRESLAQSLQPMEELMSHYERLELDASQMMQVKQGQPVKVMGPDRERIAAFFEGRLVALGPIRHGKFLGQKVLIPS
ncbi:MAG: tRNA pseudouridine(55) synthase TruB [Gemmataceae bacterium]|jgi:tRNA pseudouridine55 synthase|nr:tRNA pseudouridine(55) synthase TruB [Gemmataceae bacterium]